MKPASARPHPDTRAAVARLLYSLGWYLALPVVVAYLLWRSIRQPSYRRGWACRFGLAFPRRGSRPLLWIHAVSVGETMAARPLVDALLAQYPGCAVLLTHMTPTGFETGQRLFGDRVLRCLLPYDMPHATRRFFRHFRPVTGILIETELWPNLVASASEAGVPVALVNARLSERSLRKALRFAPLIVPAMGRLATVVAQTEADAARISRLGAVASVAGNLKFDVVPNPELVARGLRWRGLRDAPVVLAASTRDGEETAIAAAWPGGDPLLVVVPRHPQRFDDVSELLERRFGAALARRSRLDDAALAGAVARGGVMLGDSMGEMPAYYGLADVAILGGSLLPFGGQNLIEACALGVPVVIGPHTFNFAEAAEQAIAAGAAVRVATPAEAVATALGIVRDPDRLASMREAALRFAELHRGATSRTIDALRPLLPRGRS